jgi:nucleoside-diphosphate-sugar epimerase
MTNGKNIILTGGCGFIAKNLILDLLKREQDYDNELTKINKIICMDTFISSSETSFFTFLQQIKILIGEEGIDKIHLYKIDISDTMRFKSAIVNLEEKFDIYKIDEIYHLASIASPVLYKQYPLETMDCGYIGTKNVLEIAKTHGAKVLFCSTSEVYGDAEQSPQKESYYGNVNSFGVRSSYDESKRIAEALCYTYINKYKVDVKIARIFNTYGPYMMLNDGRIVTECIKSLMLGTVLNIFGDGQQTRSICNVDDTVDMLIKLMDSKCNEPVNIGNNIELTVNDIVKTIEKVYQESIDKSKYLKIQYLPLTQNDPLQRRPDLSFNKEILGSREYVSIEEGIRKTILHFLY